MSSWPGKTSTEKNLRCLFFGLSRDDSALCFKGIIALPNICTLPNNLWIVHSWCKLMSATSIFGGSPASRGSHWPVVTWLLLGHVMLGTVDDFGAACPALCRVSHNSTKLMVPKGYLRVYGMTTGVKIVCWHKAVDNSSFGALVLHYGAHSG